jgi:hypothetical protein
VVWGSAGSGFIVLEESDEFDDASRVDDMFRACVGDSLYGS